VSRNGFESATYQEWIEYGLEQVPGSMTVMLGISVG
jgi:hypothetical protein